jgi:hypothetical protein
MFRAKEEMERQKGRKEVRENQTNAKRKCEHDMREQPNPNPLVPFVQEKRNATPDPA